MLFRSAPERIGVYRAGARRIEIFDFAALIDPARVVNYAMEDGDVIYVPNNHLADIGYVLRQIAPGVSVMSFGMTVGNTAKP